ncbi:hypothetical protein LC048_14835 [Mesobacillus subterraneus]|uniref:hypothetical protein n=1 Tax=Mesobacillus subterraneus TaxID=285983 RepID=UPI001CFC80F6|nr:hypothetical protein [Mesobacillus subterraneus]WLR53788.1 hypothetical protein LC048_14835 [Mesobacillus subterraneus]
MYLKIRHNSERTWQNYQGKNMMKAFKHFVFTLWVIFMIALYAYLFWDKILILDSEQERIAPKLEEMQKQRIEYYEDK